ncbi:hypothetical protein MMC14_000096 [Varicellaria rhodocarpa]|nr:hypothetical protein [Varicellaria rhodocarpa]
MSVRFCRDRSHTIRLADWAGEEAKSCKSVSDLNYFIEKDRMASKTGVRVPLAKQPWSELEGSLIDVVYGSNSIESIGSGWNVTAELCRDDFRGYTLMCTEPGKEEYQELVDALVRRGKEEPDRETVLCSREEVARHAEALCWAIERVVIKDMDLSEEIILEVHEILTKGEPYAGKYREHRIAIRYRDDKSAECIRPQAVLEYMSKLTSDLKQELRGKAGGELDPYELAARYAHRFVCIHPFEDGNGRVKRIVLNVLLLKYAGHMAPFGGEPGEKEEYLEIARQAGRMFRQEDMEIPESSWRVHHDLVKFVIRSSVEDLERRSSCSRLEQ